MSWSAEPPAPRCCFTLRRGITSLSTLCKAVVSEKQNGSRNPRVSWPQELFRPAQVNSLLQNLLLAMGKGFQKRLPGSKHQLSFRCGSSRAHGEAAGGWVHTGGVQAAGGWVHTVGGCRLWGHTLPEHGVLLTANTAWASGTGGTQQHQCHAGGLRAHWRRAPPAKGSAHGTMHTPAQEEGARETTTPITPMCAPKPRAPSCPHRASDGRSLLLSGSD